MTAEEIAVRDKLIGRHSDKDLRQDILLLLRATKRMAYEDAAKIADQHSEQTEIGLRVLRKQKGPDWFAHLNAVKIANAIRERAREMTPFV